MNSKEWSWDWNLGLLDSNACDFYHLTLILHLVNSYTSVKTQSKLTSS